MEEIQPTAPEDFKFVYNATCMQRRREQLVLPIETLATGLNRPNGERPLANQAEAVRLQESMRENLSFLRGQWAGPLPPDLEYVQRGGYAWREPGFIDLDDSCGTEPIEGSFATGGVLRAACCALCPHSSHACMSSMGITEMLWLEERRAVL